MAMLLLMLAAGALPQDDKEAAACRERLAQWKRCYHIEVSLDDGISNLKSEVLDAKRKDLYALVNDLGGVYEAPGKLRPITTCSRDQVAFFSIPADDDGRPLPGVLLIAPLRYLGCATFYALNLEGKLARGVMQFGTRYCTGGGVYTPEAPGVAFSTKDWKKNVHIQFRISPPRESKMLFGSVTPIDWTQVEKVEGTGSLFATPLLPKEYGRWVRLDNLGKLARLRAKVRPESNAAGDHPLNPLVGKRVQAEGLAWGGHAKGWGKRIVLPSRDVIYLEGEERLKNFPNGKLVRLAGRLFNKILPGAQGYPQTFRCYALEVETLEPLEQITQEFPTVSEE